ncbi:hypothetical protein RsTz2092_08040 [Deferribacterales bacterium RsTz2092]|nr:hypothetical protein AGMMS49941_08660 [Deferribacterales bacterium]
MTSCSRRVHATTSTANIVYLNAILDSYDGLGIMRTVDKTAGRVVIYTTSYCEKTLLEVLSSLGREGIWVVVSDVDSEDIVE